MKIPRLSHHVLANCPECHGTGLVTETMPKDRDTFAVSARYCSRCPGYRVVAVEVPDPNERRLVD